MVRMELGVCVSALRSGGGGEDGAAAAAGGGGALEACTGAVAARLGHWLRSGR